MLPALYSSTGVLGHAIATASELATVYTLAIIFLILGVIMWLMICVDIPSWVAAAMFAVNVAVMIETILRRHDVTDGNLDVAISSLIFAVLLVALMNGKALLVGAVFIFIAYLSYHWSNETALRVLLPIAVIAVAVLVLALATGDFWQFAYQVLTSFTATWMIEYAGLFLAKDGDLNQIDHAAHDLLIGPRCMLDRDCAQRLWVLLFFTGVRIICVLSKKWMDRCTCAFCWGTDDSVKKHERAGLLADAVAAATAVTTTTATTATTTTPPPKQQ